jgi:hypothetical protein
MKICKHLKDLVLCDFDNITNRVIKKRTANVDNNIQNQSDKSWY